MHHKIILKKFFIKLLIKDKEIKKIEKYEKS
jgi:hypothetical protein